MTELSYDIVKDILKNECTFESTSEGTKISTSCINQFIIFCFIFAGGDISKIFKEIFENVD